MVSRAILNGWPLVPPCKAVSLPIFTVQPTISGVSAVGNTLTATSGTAVSFPNPSLSFQWLRNGVAIPGANSLAYTLVSADQSTRVDFSVTATNIIGSISVVVSGAIVAAGSEVPYPPSGFAYAYSPQDNSVVYITLFDGNSYPIIARAA